MLSWCFHSLVFISPVQSKQPPFNAPTSQHPINSDTGKYCNPPCWVTRGASQAPDYSILPKHQHPSPTTPSHYLVQQGPSVGTCHLVPMGQLYVPLLLYVVLLQPLGLLGHYGFLAFITASSPGLCKGESSLRVSVALPLFAATSGGSEAYKAQKFLEGLEHLTACHPQITISAEGKCHRLFSLSLRKVFHGERG